MGEKTFAASGVVADIAGRKARHVGTMADGVRVHVFRDELAGPEFATQRKLLADIDRPVEPAPGWRFCAHPSCGVELLDEHPTRACRAHRDASKGPRPRYQPPLAVTPAWALVTCLGPQPRTLVQVDPAKLPEGVADAAR